MTARRPSPQFDLFVPFVSDLPLRDQRETMERPFFSRAKRKRLKPIEYVSPHGEVFVNVYPNPEFGMATIWDADILIWAASTLNNLRRGGANDLPRTLNFQPYDLRTGRGEGRRNTSLSISPQDALRMAAASSPADSAGEVPEAASAPPGRAGISTSRLPPIGSAGGRTACSESTYCASRASSSRIICLGSRH